MSVTERTILHDGGAKWCVQPCSGRAGVNELVLEARRMACTNMPMQAQQGP
ncbi:hypothetical protein [Pseudovibrio japonicus]|uniref:hypothetical protein n=1 Tax=Pseudovibrio japonicus TaxID=366534 RepID=UPI001889DBFF|nr:hypothetical protein [Pseudovibrio japonicus]